MEVDLIDTLNTPKSFTLLTTLVWLTVRTTLWYARKKRTKREQLLESTLGELDSKNIFLVC